MHPEEIKAALRMKGYTLAALADDLGMSRSVVSHVVAGRAQSARVAQRIAQILGKPVVAIWPPKPQSKLRRTREQIAAQRAAALAA
ncbi:MAG: helix-turn-helix domain-containing protein [Pseudacidovorax sp.]|uniref:helix-turn-helix domain-containing protein n=1 Tax=Pseudacidovorax sp. TaxID=1934311 RepID=UPI001B4276B6|nr:helix-turn-helix domain-containing protein [Pseudacidovorax sp.]MBP6897385.1 helix-turn-helix domain-containing protein [Pseudacidovorax sp.]